MQFHARPGPQAPDEADLLKKGVSDQREGLRYTRRLLASVPLQDRRFRGSRILTPQAANRYPGFQAPGPGKVPRSQYNHFNRVDLKMLAPPIGDKPNTGLGGDLASILPPSPQDLDVDRTVVDLIVVDAASLQELVPREDPLRAAEMLQQLAGLMNSRLVRSMLWGLRVALTGSAVRAEFSFEIDSEGR